MAQVACWHGWRSLVLKILVSLVRFRPGHQEHTSRNAHSCKWAFLFLDRQSSCPVHFRSPSLPSFGHPEKNRPSRPKPADSATGIFQRQERPPRAYGRITAWPILLSRPPKLSSAGWHSSLKGSYARSSLTLFFDGLNDWQFSRHCTAF